MDRLAEILTADGIEVDTFDDRSIPVPDGYVNVRTQRQMASSTRVITVNVARSVIDSEPHLVANYIRLKYNQ